LVRETLIQYSNHIKQLTDQDMNSKNEEEITSLLANIENLQAAKVIYQNYNSTFDFIAKKYFNTKMGGFAKEKKLDYTYKGSGETYLNFNLTKTSWQDKYWIGFNFEKYYYYGICNYPEKYKISLENRMIIRKELEPFGFDVKETEWWPCLIYIPSLSIETWESDVRDSEKFFEDCKQRIETLLSVIEKLDL